MRRIIERVVTVVTTTTWKISSETDPPPVKPTTDPADELTETAQNLPINPPVTEEKEDVLVEIVQAPEPPAASRLDRLSISKYSERKRKP
ncbi:MAG TPA: hypothetical protein VJ785_00425 [Anaerolineales bacterium]|nr:hypothetical protein [Anaerolineales bacterium]